ncbi:MAG: glycosyltransferase family 4 protein [Syntrophomonadaceae bacterium]
MAQKKIFMCTVLAEAFYKSRGELITEFVKMGYEVVLAAPEEEDFLAREFPGMPVKYYQICLARTGLNPWQDLKLIGQLREIMRQEKPRLTYAFGGAKAAIYTAIAAAREKVPGNFCMINGLGSIFRGSGFRNSLIGGVMNRLFQYSLAKTNGVLFQNADDLNDFLSRGLVEPEKCSIVNGSGVNLDRFVPAPLPDRTIFLFVGRLLRDKGVYELVEAARLVKPCHPEAEFWIVGGYDTNPTAVKESEVAAWSEAGLIKYFGRQDDVLPFYQGASVFVLPSYHEGTPRTCLEAMAVGRPVITTDAPGCKETVLDGETGFLVPVRNSRALAEKIVYFIDNPRTISVMGDRALEFVAKKYDVHAVNRAIIDFMLQRTSKL